MSTGRKTAEVTQVIKQTNVEMPAGEYIVGDPCYAVPDERWMEWLEASDYTNSDRMHPLLGELDGRSVLGFSTQFGDGVYHGTDGHEYGVDAGLIGLVPVEVADMAEDATWRRCSQQITFAEDTECSRTDEGTLKFGSLTIQTGDEY